MVDLIEAKLRDVLREKGLALFSGRIDVATGAGGLGGVVHMSEGQVLDARLGTTSGEPALWRMLLADKTRIALEAGKPRATSGAVLGKPDALLDRFDERVLTLARVAEHLGGFERVWALRFDALANVLDDLPDAINPVLRLLDGKRSVRHVVAECGLDDMLALRILGKLLSQGVLVLPDNASLVPSATSSAPIDVNDDGLEAALAASLAEIEAEAAPLSDGTHEPIELGARPSVVHLDSSDRATPNAHAAEANAEPAAAVHTVHAVHAVPAAAALPSAPRPVTNDDLRSWLGNEEAFFSAAHLRLPSGDVVIPDGRLLQQQQQQHQQQRLAHRRIGLVPMAILFVAAVALGMLIASLR